MIFMFLFITNSASLYFSAFFIITTEIKAGIKYLCPQNLVNHIIFKVKKQSVLLPLATLTVVIICLLNKFKKNCLQISICLKSIDSLWLLLKVGLKQNW